MANLVASFRERAEWRLRRLLRARGGALPPIMAILAASARMRLFMVISIFSCLIAGGVARKNRIAFYGMITIDKTRNEFVVVAL
mmetsp:Transcript_21330/g.44518  ORF Transcript_21330/g.44518 Transcript_21330/m.44518 type:complete len:84 (+) Transcript_21330:646-897(+)